MINGNGNDGGEIILTDLNNEQLILHIDTIRARRALARFKDKSTTPKRTNVVGNKVTKSRKPKGARDAWLSDLTKDGPDDSFLDDLTK